jgi:hypothetical protein
MNSEAQSYSDLIARCMQQIDSSVVDAFRQFLLGNGDREWLIVSDYHMEKADAYENYVSVFTVLPGAEHFIKLEEMNAGLPTKLSDSDVTDSDITFLKNLNHFTFVFVSDKKFRPAAQTIEAARASMDVSIEKMMQWPNAAQCKPIIAKFRQLRQQANASAFNLKLHNYVTLSASCVSAIALMMLQTLRVETINWLSDRDAIIDHQDGLVYTMFHLNMDAFREKYSLKPFNLVWFGENADKEQSAKKKPLALAPYIRVPDYLAAPVGASQLNVEDAQHLERGKYQRVLAHIIADNDNIAVLQLVNDPGWALQRIAVSLNPPAKGSAPE